MIGSTTRRPSHALLHAAAVVATLAVFVFAFIFFGSVIAQANSVLSLSFWTTAPEQAGRAGGIYPVLVSTFVIVALCASVALPIGLGTAAFLVVFTRKEKKTARLLRICLDTLAATPSIVFGLFGASFFGEVLGLGFSLLTGALTLTCMILPLLVRMTEKALREVPADYSLQAEALGFSRANLLLRVLVPLAAPALSAAFMLGIARALSETAALLFTSGYVLRTPESLLDSGRTLSVHIYDLAMNVPGGDTAAFTSALGLLCILFVISSVAALLQKHYMTAAETR